ncbi:tetraacyldisaccharide 4'-kinase [Acidihalobacter ferrooxydans]|uniref:Tetraacyldisaccharide 4'-kinase n=1 Tax=Acidihalobacter ferrooxydans TaxID=1765967 RepID=A0A1P8UFP0_9GAMM|nr:tetraacyldisaccharide 4'-kinase [Acidihalobacter ferrooxydans]APZ42656.1 tetraacyldisaccharide 4'-kinase [Acidihalobacter ferrooxydans]
MSLEQRVQQLWSRCGPVSTLLLPLSALYCAVVRRRRHAFLAAPPPALPVPVVVVGNITVGGTGKTPMTIALCEWLRGQGWRPGVVSRGYGGSGAREPKSVQAQSRASEVGDEPLLIALRAQVPGCVCADRMAAAQALLDAQACDILIADDGLQHYRLPRDVEIAMLDGRRRLGNGRCLPAGPLREPAIRLQAVDFVIVTEGQPGAGEYGMALRLDAAWALREPTRRQPLSSFAAQPAVHAVAGIGHPERFFAALEAAGLAIVRHAFPDHHGFDADDLAFGDDAPVLMTEKDAVKCLDFAPAACWAVPATADLPPDFTDALAARLRTHHG